MNKGKSIGICCLFAAVAILAVALFYQVPAESEDSYRTETGNEVTFPAVSGQEASAVQTTETVATATENVAREEQPAEQTEELERGEYSKVQMELRDMDDEVLSLIGVTKDRLAEEIRIFANGYGFADMTETHYYGETIIDHKKNTVSAGFYFQTPESGTFKFHVIVQRDKKTLRFEPW